ncbi:MAG: energy transducer TonB [Deltaproteobacteria bacterium]|jgi:protein TonB|nr:energy transducer TonB [Deltaproteobacteria bacterium]
MEPSAPKERDVFKTTLFISGLIHFFALIMVIAVGHAQPKQDFTPIAVVDFANFDPEGGDPEGGEEEKPPEPPSPPPEPEEPEELPDLVESQAEEAPEIAPPPPPEKKKPERKKPKVQPPPPAGPPSPVAGTGQGGSGGGTGRGNPDAMSAYKGQISRKLNQFKKYPTAAMTKGLKGVVRVNFRVNAQGRVSRARMVSSSGHAVLDEEAMALLKRCSPFPPIPASLGLTELELNVPINFSVRGV